MSAETKRDWAADLKLCEAATPEWSIAEVSMPGEALLQLRTGPAYSALPFRSVQMAYRDAFFAASARAGWPAAIREAMRVEGLEAEVARLTADMHDCFVDGWRSRLAESEQRRAADAKKAEAEVERLTRERDEARRIVNETGAGESTGLRDLCAAVCVTEAERERDAALADADALREAAQRLVSAVGVYYDWTEGEGDADGGEVAFREVMTERANVAELLAKEDGK